MATWAASAASETSTSALRSGGGQFGIDVSAGADQEYSMGNVAADDVDLAALSIDLTDQPTRDARLGTFGVLQQLSRSINNLLIAIDASLAQDLFGWFGVGLRIIGIVGERRVELRPVRSELAHDERLQAGVAIFQPGQ